MEQPVVVQDRDPPGIAPSVPIVVQDMTEDDNHSENDAVDMDATQGDESFVSAVGADDSDDEPASRGDGHYSLRQRVNPPDRYTA